MALMCVNHTVDHDQKYKSILKAGHIFARETRENIYPLDMLAGDGKLNFFAVGTNTFHQNGHGFIFDGHLLIEKYDAAIGSDLGIDGYDRITEALGYSLAQFQYVDDAKSQRVFDQFKANTASRNFFLNAAKSLQAVTRKRGHDAHQLLDEAIKREWDLELVTPQNVSIKDATTIAPIERGKWLLTPN